MSRTPIRRTMPEPKVDLAAQTRAMMDPRHPKDAVFAARGNEAALPQGPLPGVRRVAKPSGTLLTTQPKKAKAFARGVSDAGLGKILGLPQSKTAAGKPGVSVVQAQDNRGAVVTEAVTSPAGLAKTARTLAKHVPAGGSLSQTSAPAALTRRAALRAKDL
jgi:hypothetical protein